MQHKEIKLGSLVVWSPGLTSAYHENPWSSWVGIVIREIPGTSEVKVVHWNAQENGGKVVRTSNPKRDLRLAYEI